MRKALDGRWELEDDSPQAVLCVEMTPRAAYTVDELDPILSRVYLARAIARRRIWEESQDPKALLIIDSYSMVWQGFLDDQIARAHGADAC